jgi:hypothetical protein
MNRFYVDIINHHVGYYSIFDRYTNQPALGCTLIDYAGIEPENADRPLEYGYNTVAAAICAEMNRLHQDDVEYSAGLEQDVR